MKLKPYFLALGPEDRLHFVNRAGTTIGYMNLLLCGARNPSPNLSRRLVVASGGALSLEELRPDIYAPLIQEELKSPAPS